MEHRADALLTCGYEGFAQETFFDALRADGVEVLWDVRYRAGSRKAGFSKTPLRAACQVLGMEYRHDPRLGTPPDIMKRLRETGSYDWEAYEAFLDNQGDALEALAASAATQRIALLCYEADPKECHRNVVAREAARINGLQVTHL